MKRRSLITRSLWLFLPFNYNSNLWKNKKTERGTFSKDGNRLRFYQKEVTESFSCLFIADTHLFKDDERGNEYTMYSGRMAKAYNKTKHFQTGEDTHPEKAWVETLQIAKKENVSLLILAGDIFSFPSEAAISFVVDELQKVGIPYIFTAGNHDWHYEGMSGSSDVLRDTWIKKRLLNLYQDENPMFAVRNLNGISIITIDNSTYEINEEQLHFFENQISKGDPILLCVHIPFYVQGRNLGFGCAHPEWNGKNDKNYELERRERWRDSGHSPTTLKFFQRILTATNLIGIVAGHIHRQSIDILKNGVPQIVTTANANGGFLSLHFEKENIKAD
jgi:predicted phosphodiesterase